MARWQGGKVAGRRSILVDGRPFYLGAQLRSTTVLWSVGLSACWPVGLYTLSASVFVSGLDSDSASESGSDLDMVSGEIWQQGSLAARDGMNGLGSQSVQSADGEYRSVQE